MAAACTPAGPLAVEESDGPVAEDPGGDDGSPAVRSPSIVAHAVAGTNANAGDATGISLSYDHPGGHLLVFVRHNRREIRGLSARFNGETLPLLASADAGPSNRERAGYLFAADVAAGSGSIVVDFQGVSRDQRGILALSVADSDGVRATATAGERAPGANGTVDLSVMSEQDDLVLGYVAWRRSEADVRSQSSGQSTAAEDDRPTRQHAHRKAGSANGTTLSVTFANDPTSTVYLAVSLKPSAP